MQSYGGTEEALIRNERWSFSRMSTAGENTRTRKALVGVGELVGLRAVAKKVNTAEVGVLVVALLVAHARLVHCPRCTRKKIGRICAGTQGARKDRPMLGVLSRTIRDSFMSAWRTCQFLGEPGSDLGMQREVEVPYLNLFGQSEGKYSLWGRQTRKWSERIYQIILSAGVPQAR